MTLNNMGIKTQLGHAPTIHSTVNIMHCVLLSES